MIILSARRTWITLRKLRSIQATPVLAQTMIMAGVFIGRKRHSRLSFLLLFCMIPTLVDGMADAMLPLL